MNSFCKKLPPKAISVLIALNYEAIRSIPIPKPSIPIQQKVIDKLNTIRDESKRLKSEAESEWQAAKD